MDGTRLDQIIAASEHLFSRQGYHATTMRQVARAVELQGGSLYSHIGGKEEVLAAIIERATRQFELTVVPVLTARYPAPARLRAAVRGHLGVLAVNHDAATVFLHDWRHLSSSRRALVLHQRDGYEAHWRQLMVDGMAEGTFAPVDPHLAAVACLSLCNWTYQWFDPAGPQTIDEVADAFSELLLRGLMRGRASKMET